MAKINKKSETKKPQSKNINHNIKQCFVNLIGMSKKEYDMYSKADEIVTINFDIKISDNEIQIGTGNGVKKTFERSIILYEIEISFIRACFGIF